jgi:hypothetical protein
MKQITHPHNFDGSKFEASYGYEPISDNGKIVNAPDTATQSDIDSMVCNPIKVLVANLFEEANRIALEVCDRNAREKFLRLSVKLDSSHPAQSMIDEIDDVLDSIWLEYKEKKAILESGGSVSSMTVPDPSTYPDFWDVMATL